MINFCMLLVVAAAAAAVTAVVYQPIKKQTHAIRPSVVLVCTTIVINLANCSAASTLVCPVYVDFLHRFDSFFFSFSI